MKKTLIRGLLVTVLIQAVVGSAWSKGEDFGDVVKMIEQFYHVKHTGLPFLAKAGIKATTTVAKLAGGPKRQLAEAGSVKVAYFEDQEFAERSLVDFKASVNSKLTNAWSPLVQVVSPKDDSQTYVYLRNAGEKFKVLVINIEKRDGSVVQVTLAPQTLAMLMKDPDQIGSTITADATTNDNE
jgi:hypothetical protein